MANYLEQLLKQYYEWKGCVVATNRRVGRLQASGYAGELDLVVYDPQRKEVTHYEPSLDGMSWAEREARYRKKFYLGKKHILKDVFPWLPKNIPILQVAIFNNVPSNRRAFLDAKAIGIDQLVAEITEAVKGQGYVGVNAIPEGYDLLRTIHLVLCGYYWPVPAFTNKGPLNDDSDKRFAQAARARN